MQGLQRLFLCPAWVLRATLSSSFSWYHICGALPATCVAGVDSRPLPCVWQGCVTNLPGRLFLYMARWRASDRPCYWLPGCAWRTESCLAQQMALCRTIGSMGLKGDRRQAGGAAAEVAGEAHCTAQRGPLERKQLTPAQGAPDRLAQGSSANPNPCGHTCCFPFFQNFT